MGYFFDFLPAELLEILITYLESDIIELEALSKIIENVDVYKILTIHNSPFLLKYSNAKVDWKDIFTETFFDPKQDDLLSFIMESRLVNSSHSMIKLYLT